MAPEHEASPDAVTADPRRAVFDASPVCSAVTRRRDGKILFVNPACLRMLGWTEAEVVGRTMIEVGFWTAEHRATMLDRLDGAGVVHDLEQTITTRDGRTIVALMSISAVVLGGEPSSAATSTTSRAPASSRTSCARARSGFRQVTETLEQGFLLRDTEPPSVLYASPRSTACSASNSARCTATRRPS